MPVGSRVPKLTGRTGKRRVGWLYLLLLAVIVVSVAREVRQRRYPDSNLVPGEPLPEYSALSLDSTRVSMRDFGGKVVLLSFWATWCSPCLDQLPALQSLKDEFGDQGLDVVSVSIDDEDPAWVQTFLDARGHDWLNLFDDPDHIVGVFAWGNTIPRTVLVNRDGTVGVWWRGPLDPDVPENRALIEDALSGRAVWSPSG